MNKATALLFDSKASTWGDRYKTRLKTRIELFSKLANKYIPEESSLLDLGCGSGVITRELSKLGHNIIGIDCSKSMIEEANKQNIPNSTFIQGNFENSSFEAKFSGVICSSVFEYVVDPNQFLHKISDSVKEGGIIIISIPNTRSLIRILERTLKSVAWLLKYIPKLSSFIDYLNISSTRWSLKKMKQQLKNNKIEIIETHFENKTFGKIWPNQLSYTMLVLVCQKSKR